MSIIHEDDTGWLVDHEGTINKDHKTSAGLRCMEGLFEILHPFMMDSQFQKLQSQNADLPLGQKGKKRKAEVNFGEVVFLENYEKIKLLLLKALKQLVDIGKTKGHLSSEQPMYEDNNKVAREAAADAKGCGDNMKELVSMAAAKETEDAKGPVFITGCERFPDVINRMVHNPSSDCTRAKLLGSTFILPPNSSFLLSDFSFMKPLLQDGKKYDLIVMDPPWQNKSVKRKKIYDTLRTEKLRNLPVNELSKDGTVVVVWVTNRVQHQQIVTEKLFPAWNIDQVSKWYWLKVTKSGVPIYNLDSAHRKPYESILIGRVRLSSEDNAKLSKKIPNDKVIVSIPCSIHSRKPPLSEVLKDYITEAPSCLELFARNLRPNWTSWGNEVLSFQHEDFFQETQKDSLSEK